MTVAVFVPQSKDSMTLKQCSGAASVKVCINNPHHLHLYNNNWSLSELKFSVDIEA